MLSVARSHFLVVDKQIRNGNLDHKTSMITDQYD